MNIYFINGLSHYSSWIPDAQRVYSIEEADLVIGEGGADVHPLFYKQENKYSYSDRFRDIKEYNDYSKAIKLNKPILGICKGSQWACVLAGGALFQDVTDHGRSHEVSTFNGETIQVTSTHHQMADLRNLVEGEDYILLGWSSGISRYYKNGISDNNICEREPEFVYYPKINALGIQSHPEMVRTSEENPYHNFCKKVLYENLLHRQLSV